MGGFLPAPTVVSLPVYEYVLTSPVSLSENSITTVVSSATLPVGTYLVNFGAPILIGGTNSTIDLTATFTGTHTLAGQYSDTLGYTTAIGSGAILKTDMGFILVVSTPGVLSITAEMTGSTTSSTILSTSHTTGYPSVTGLSLTKVA